MKYIKKNEFDLLKPVSINNKGIYGSCYFYRGKVLKVFNIPESALKEIKKNVKKNCSLSIEGFAFPTEIVKVKNCNFAYLMPYLKGSDFEHFTDDIIYKNNDISFDDLSFLYKNGLIKIKDLSRNNIVGKDIGFHNSKILNGKEINFFDTDFFHSSDNKLITLKQNIKNYNECFSTFFINIFVNLNSECEKKLPTVFSYIYEYKAESINFVDDVLEDIYKNTKATTIKQLIK